MGIVYYELWKKGNKIIKLQVESYFLKNDSNFKTIINKQINKDYINLVKGLVDKGFVFLHGFEKSI